MVVGARATTIGSRVILLLASLAWLGLIFAIARVAESRRWARLSSHPLVYALSLGAYATSWTYYGAVGLARVRGLAFLAVSLGPMLACLLVGAVWLPLLRLVRRHQLATLADLFAFRYRSQTLGVLVTATMLVGLVPYLAVQVRAVAHSAVALVPQVSPVTVGAAFCALMLGFAALFGARHATTRERHPGLVVAIAFESAFKLLALVLVGVVAWTVLSHGASVDAPRAAPLLDTARTSSFASVCLVSLGVTFLLPREFHMAFTEAPEGEQGARGLRTAAWGFPLLLLLINVPLLLILWAGQQLAPDGNADLYVLTVAAETRGLEPLAWLGGVSAASAMVIVETLALSSMVLRHFVLPWRRPGSGNVYGDLVHARRVVLMALLVLAFLVFVGIERLSPASTARGGGLAQVGLVSFAAVLQYLPGFLGVLFFPHTTRAGVTAGLVVGMVAWSALLAAPLVGVDALALPPGFAGADPYGMAVLIALALNVLTTAVVSFNTVRSLEEARAAAACRSEVTPGVVTGLPTSVAELVDRVATVLGRETAQVEVDRTLRELQLTPHEQRPGALERLTTHLEANLTGLIGPVLSHAALWLESPGDAEATIPLGERVRQLERQIEVAARSGGASAAAALQAWLRSVFDALPVGVTVLGARGDVVWWNHTLERLTHRSRDQMVGRLLAVRAPELAAAMATDGLHELDVDGARVTWDVTSAELKASAAMPPARVVVVDDLTAQRALEAAVVHHERLASIGRLAAGVAHEIGNPLAALLTVARVMEQEDEPVELRARLRSIVACAGRIDAIVRNLMTFARAPAQTGREVGPVALDQVVRDAIELVSMSREVRVALTLASPAPVVDGVASELVQVLVNLLTNALDASPPMAPVKVSVGEQGDHAEVIVEDQGPGVPLEVKARLFEPFFTTKGPGAGTGLGLSIAYGLVRAHHGQLELDSDDGAGTRVRLRLPRSFGPASVRAME